VKHFPFVNPIFEVAFNSRGYSRGCLLRYRLSSSTAVKSLQESLLQPSAVSTSLLVFSKLETSSQMLPAAAC
jgi:hypothetical protein